MDGNARIAGFTRLSPRRWVGVFGTTYLRIWTPQSVRGRYSGREISKLAVPRLLILSASSLPQSYCFYQFPYGRVGGVQLPSHYERAELCAIHAAVLGGVGLVDA